MLLLVSGAFIENDDVSKMTRRIRNSRNNEVAYFNQRKLLQEIDFVNRSEFVKILLYASTRGGLEKAAQLT